MKRIYKNSKMLKILASPYYNDLFTVKLQESTMMPLLSDITKTPHKSIKKGLFLGLELPLKFASLNFVISSQMKPKLILMLSSHIIYYSHLCRMKTSAHSCVLEERL